MKPAEVSAEYAVAEAYKAYWPASVRAATLPKDQGRTVLAPHAEPEHVEETLNGAAEWRRKGLEPWGHVTVRVLSTTVRGREARLVECQDASTAGVADARTHRLMPRTKGSPNVHIEADMRQGADGRWRLRQLRILESPCTAP